MMLWFVERTVRPMELDASNAGRLALLRELGLGSVATEKPVTRHVENSPTGKPGTVIAFSRDGLSGEEQIALVKYDAAAQDWHRCAGGKYWCGKLKGETIAPESLRRDDAVPGYMVRLGDGHDWEIARAISERGVSSLTRRVVINDDGTIGKGDVIGRHAEFARQSGLFFDEWVTAIDEGRAAEWGLSALTNLAVLGLQANYWIGTDEAVAVLGLFDDDNVWAACKATISWPTVETMIAANAAAQKKTELASMQNGSSGAPG